MTGWDEIVSIEHLQRYAAVAYIATLTYIGKRLCRNVDCVHWTNGHNGRTLDIIMNCPSCPLVSNGHNGHIMPFNGQNRHGQWTQWTSIGSILMCPIDQLTALQLVNWPFLVNPVQWTH